MTLTTDDQNELFQLRIKSRLDTRTTACRVTVQHPGTDQTVVSGYVHYHQVKEFVCSLAAEVYGSSGLTFNLKVLDQGEPEFAAVQTPFAPLWRNPDASDPELLDTQALYGAVLRTYQTEDGFLFVQHSDGYVGYVPQEALKPISVEEYLAWKNQEHAITLQSLTAGSLILPPGVRLPHHNGSLKLVDDTLLPVSPEQVAVFNPSLSHFIDTAVARAAEFMETPYLWGGKSAEGIDCSGFVQTLALQEGIFLPRDASMQCHVGEVVGFLPDFADLLPGDLMFFMNDKAIVFHVGIYLGNRMYMHSAGKTGPTKSSVQQDGENYMDRYGSAFCYARRIHR